MEEALNVGTQDMSVKHEECMKNMNHNNSDFHDSSKVPLHQHKTIITTYEIDGSSVVK